MERLVLAGVVFFFTMLLTACGQSAAPLAAAPTDASAPVSAAPLVLSSAAFAGGEAIPRKYTCAGENVSPPLAWTTPPAAAQSLALIMDDPDAPGGTWDHWLLFNLPPHLTSLAENAAPPPGAQSGLNSWQTRGLESAPYGGPCPPPGAPHRYIFTLYALDTPLNFTASPDKAALLQAMQGHILSQSQLMGTFSR